MFLSLDGQKVPELLGTLFFLGVDKKVGDSSNRNCPVPLEVQVNYWTYEICQIF